MNIRPIRVYEVARELGVSESWLRRAEGRGRIPKARRDMNGWRIYSQADIAALRLVLVSGWAESDCSGIGQSTFEAFV